MTPSATLPSSTSRPVVRLYRHYARLPASQRWAVGFAAPIVCGALFGAVGVLAWVLAVSVFTDLLWRRIFNAVTAPAFGCLIAMHLIGGVSGLPTAEASAVGFAACFGLMLGLYFVFGGGEGDLKLAAVVGVVLGAYHGAEGLVAGYLFAAAVSLAIVGVRVVRRTPRPLSGTLPMAPFFAAGVVFTLTF